MVNHQGQFPSVTISFNLMPGTSIGQAVTAIQQLAGHRQAQVDFDVAHEAEVEKWFAALNIDAGALQGGRRKFARRCLDWTERKPHLAGALGAALFDRMLAGGWLARRQGTRALRVTERGTRELKNRLGVDAWQ